MNWWDRIFLTAFAGSFIALCYLMFFDSQKKSLNTNRIILKIEAVQDHIEDLKELAKNLQVRNAVSHINVDPNPDYACFDKSFKIALISEVIETKAQMMNEAINDAIKEIKKPLTLEIV